MTEIRKEINTHSSAIRFAKCLSCHPRSNLSYLNTQEKLQKPAFYILLGEDESTNPQAYIGEMENYKGHVKDHDSKKAFWQKALIFVSKDADITKVDVQYLEHKAIVFRVYIYISRIIPDKI